MKTLTGIAASPGYALGKAKWLQEAKDEDLSDHLIDDVEGEVEILLNAIARAKVDIEEEKQKLSEKLSDAELGIFDAHIGILEDPELLDQTVEQIRQNAINSAFLFKQVAAGFQEQLLALNDEYLSARANDIAEVAARVVSILTKREADRNDLSEDCIVVCYQLTTHQLADLNTSKILGIVTAEGGLTDHVSIISKALGVPLVVGLKDSIEELKEASHLIVDGRRGIVNYGLTSNEILHFEEESKSFELQRKKAFVKRKAIAQSKSGRSIKVFANIGTLDDVDDALANGAEGIGLLRTELSFLRREKPPSEEEHLKFYKAILEKMEGRETVIRLMDFGTDKPLSYLKIQGEENPALGVRALRLGFKYYEVLLGPQIRALIRLSKNHRIQVLCPMISTPEDVKQVKTAFQKEEELMAKAESGFKSQIDLGIMVEVPYVAFFPQLFVDHVDFFSFGTNDLAQFLMAADRSNSEVSSYLDYANKGIVELIKQTAELAHANGKWVGICGEMASDLQLLSVFLDIGVDEISMPSTLIPEVKEYIRMLD